MRTLALTILSLTTFSAYSAEVYKTVDHDGVVKFSDRPDSTQTSERVVVITAEPVARPTPAPGPEAGKAGQPTQTAAGESEREQTPEERAAERAKYCQIATERAERYRTSRRLYRELPDGEREYLDDAQLDAARANAEADVANWCD